MSQLAGGPQRGRSSRIVFRYGRIGVLVCSVLLTVSAAVAAERLPPEQRQRVAAASDGADEAVPTAVTPHGGSGGAGVGVGKDARDAAGSDRAPGRRASGRTGRHADPAPPAGSGRGRRVVLDLSAQRVWLIGRDGRVATSYLVSGSVTDNLASGRYAVYSRSRHATSFDLQSTMGYMVRFAHGQRAAIGFHDIPVDAQGEPLQKLSELGTPQSHGCIRQRRADARRMWEFATLGTPVVVTA